MIRQLPKKRHVLVDMITDLFSACLAAGDIPSKWKAVKVTPLYKKGRMLDPGNYRMLAVSSAVYRIYASVLNKLVSEWAFRQSKIPDCQFGFCFNRSTTQALFVLKHLISAKSEHKSKRLYAAFVDFKAAYDTVSRERLWSHLSAIRMPPRMLKAVKGLYRDDQYVLCDGVATTDPVSANIGVRQGCPLSPLLFSLYISDVQDYFMTDRGAVTGIDTLKVPTILFADDLTLTSNTPCDLQCQIESLARYADFKQLTVNVAKTCVACFGPRHAKSRGDSKLSFTYKGSDLAIMNSFRYLGIVIDEHAKMTDAMHDVAKRVAVASHSIWKKLQDLQVTDSLQLCTWLWKVFILPTALYGCQVWSPSFLSLHDCFATSVQKHLTSHLKQMLGVKASTLTHTVLTELGLKPVITS